MPLTATRRLSRLTAPVGLAALGALAMAAIQVAVGGGVDDAWSGEVAAAFLTFLVSYQAGITVAQQALLNERPGRRVLQVASGAGVVTLWIAGTADLPRAAGGVMAAISGGLLGLVAGELNVRLLLPDLRTQAQARNALRGVAWLALVACVRWIGWPSRSLVALLLTGLVAVALVEAVTRLMAWTAVELRRPSSSALLPALAGLGAALIYRNDTSIVRLRTAGDSSFVDLNLGITGYLLANGLFGLFVGSLLLPELRADRVVLHRAAGWTRRTTWPATAVAAPLLLAAIMAHGSARSALAISASIPLALAVTLASVCLHVAGRSMWIYAIASGSTLLLLVIPHEGLVYGLLVTNAAQLLAFRVLLSSSIPREGPR